MEKLHHSLFLHGGPGLHSAVERAWFTDTLPIVWWDQPGVATDANPYAALVLHATRQVEALAASGDGQIDLIAHSFGGQLAVELARKCPALIRRITLLGCPPDPIRQILLLARRLLESGSDYPGLTDALLAAKDHCDTNSFFALVQACYPGGAIPAIYFGPDSAVAMARYLSLAAQMPPMDGASFFMVMQTLLQTPNPAQCTDYGGEVNILLGQYDPLLDLETDKQKWLALFPDANIQIVNAGHGIHFELPAKVWFGVGT